MKKTLFLAMSIIGITLASTITSLADWEQGEDGWRYQCEDGFYAKSGWKEIDGKYYYFGYEGYMYSDVTTPDGQQVGSDGACIQYNPIYSDSAMQEFIGSATDSGNYIQAGDGMWITIDKVENGIVYGYITFGRGTGSGESYAEILEPLDVNNTITVVMEGFNPVYDSNNEFRMEECADKVSITFNIGENSNEILVKRIEKGNNGKPGFKWFDRYYTKEKDTYYIYPPKPMLN